MLQLKQYLWIPIVLLCFSNVHARSLPEFTGLVEQY